MYANEVKKMKINFVFICFFGNVFILLKNCKFYIDCFSKYKYCDQTTTCSLHYFKIKCRIIVFYFGYVEFV